MAFSFFIFLLIELNVCNFISLIKKADIDGVITVDYPPEESKKFVNKLKKNNIDSIFLLSPTTDDARIELIIDNGQPPYVLQYNLV